MKLFIAVIFLAASIVNDCSADVSHLVKAGYTYDVPSPAFELPSAPIKEYLPPTTVASVKEENLPEVVVPQPSYLPPSNEYLPPIEPEVVEEPASEPIVEPVKEYLPPSEAPSTEYLPPSVAPPQEYQSPQETGGYRYDAPLTKFRF